MFNKTTGEGFSMKILLTGEVAEILRISEGYLREPIRKGKIKAYKEFRRGGFRITEKAVEEYVKGKHKFGVGLTSEII